MLWYEYGNQKCRGSDFERLVELIYEVLPYDVPYWTLRESVRELAGVTLTKTRIDQAVWRVAGNMPHMRTAEKPVAPWEVQTIPEWVPAQIISSRPGRNRYGNVGQHFTLQILAGSPCPLRIEKFWTARYCRFVARYLGFTGKLPGPYSDRLPRFYYRHPTEFVTLRLWLLIEPELSEKEPGFRRVDCRGRILEWNKKQMQRRDRLDEGYRCPKGYSHCCYQCPVGLDACAAATHRQSWYKDACTNCEKRRWHDPGLSTELCIRCYLRAVLSRKE